MSSCTNHPWGWSTWVDLYNCDPGLIRSRKAIADFVVQLADLLDVKRFGEPTIVRFGQDPRVCGYSMVQLIETSLLSAHFIEQTNMVCLDIFSCAEYSAEDAARFSRGYFLARDLKWGTTLRGVAQQPPRDPTKPDRL